MNYHPINLTIGDLYDINLNEMGSIGFTVGKGKKLYWYVLASPSGCYSVLAIEPNGTLSHRRYVSWDQQVTIRFVEE